MKKHLEVCAGKAIYIIFNNEKKAVEALHQGNGSGPFFLLVLLTIKNVIFLCKENLHIILAFEMRYNCTSSTVKDFYFLYINKRFCTGCIRYFCQKYTPLFLSIDFRIADFFVM